MSFGWSAGDIASALKLIYNIIEALDSVDGVASDYREAVGFLQALKRSLDPLQVYTSWHAYPNYGDEIKLQILRIKGPLERFLEEVVKFEPSLGAKAREGYHRNVLRKLQWHVSMSKIVLKLKKKIESHMRVIDTLLQRLTLDIVYTTQQHLPDHIRSIFEETFRPNLVGFLRENLVPLNASLLEGQNNAQSTFPDATVSRLSTQVDNLSTEVQNIRAQLGQPISTRKQVQSKESLEEILGLSQAARPRRLITPTAIGVISLERLLAAQSNYNLNGVLCDDIIDTVLSLMMKPNPQRYGTSRLEIKKNVLFAINGSQIQTSQYLLQESIDASNIPESDEFMWYSLERSGEALLSLASLGFEVCSGRALDDQELLGELGLPSGWQFEKAAIRRLRLKGIEKDDPDFSGCFGDSLLHSWISLASPLLKYMKDFRGKKVPVVSTRT